MILITHIIFALSSLVASSVLYFLPSRVKLRLTYGLVAATLASGTYLVISTSAHLASACLSGLVYLAAVSVGIVGARRKLARAKIASR